MGAAITVGSRDSVDHPLAEGTVPDSAVQDPSYPEPRTTSGRTGAGRP